MKKIIFICVFLVGYLTYSQKSVSSDYWAGYYVGKNIAGMTHEGHERQHQIFRQTVMSPNFSQDYKHGVYEGWWDFFKPAKGKGGKIGGKYPKWSKYYKDDKK
ncbi:MAG: hypothetical protein V3U92_17465 [Cellulophaga sp.]